MPVTRGDELASQEKQNARNECNKNEAREQGREGPDAKEGASPGPGKSGKKPA
jgi:hypothetical protein